MFGPSCPKCATPYEWSCSEVEEEVWAPKIYFCSACHGLFTVDVEEIRALQRVARGVWDGDPEVFEEAAAEAERLMEGGDVEAATDALLSPLYRVFGKPPPPVRPPEGEDPARWWRAHLQRLHLDASPSCFDALDAEAAALVLFSWMPAEGTSERIDVEITDGPDAGRRGRLWHVMDGWACVDVDGEAKSFRIDEIARV